MNSYDFGQGAWVRTMGAVSGDFFKFGEYLVFAAFAFHAVNGIRLVLVELGFGLGRPIEPVYPYRTSVDVQRFLAVSVLVVGVVLAFLGALDLLAVD